MNLVSVSRDIWSAKGKVKGGWGWRKGKLNDYRVEI